VVTFRMDKPALLLAPLMVVALLLGGCGLGSTLARWTPGTLERFGSGVGHVGVATDVSDDGAVMVGFEDGFADLGGVVWSGACGLQFLPSVERRPMHPTAISRDGGTVVGYVDYDSDNRIAVRWRADTGAEILAPDIDGSEVAYLATPADVASDGSVVGTVLRQTSDGGYTSRAVRWTPDHGVVHLDPAASPTGVAAVFAASADGRIVLGAQGIWDEAHGWRDVATVVAAAGGSFEGWRLGAALAVSADGKTIVGNGVCDGKTLAWLARLK